MRDRMKTSRSIIPAALAAGALAALPAAAQAQGTPPSYADCLAEQEANANVDCVGAAQVGKPPKRPKAKRTVRVSWSLGACGGEAVTEREWEVRVLRDDRLGTLGPAGERRFLFGGATDSGTRDIRLPRGRYHVELALRHARTADGGDCGPIDVRSAAFRVR
jgi:hypothetical protein